MFLISLVYYFIKEQRNSRTAITCTFKALCVLLVLKTNVLSPFVFFQVSCDSPSLSHCAPACTVSSPDLSERCCARSLCCTAGTHGFRPSVSPLRLQAQAVRVCNWGCAADAGVRDWANVLSEDIHQHMGCSHTWRSGGSRSSCRKTWLHQ